MTITRIFTRCLTLAVAGVMAAASAPLAAQRATPDARWQGWLGCWQPVSAASADSYTEWMTARARDAGLPTLCIVPSATPSAVDFVTVDAGAVRSRETIDAASSHVARTRDGCKGWEGANWSTDGRRIYLQTEYTCAGGVAQTSSGMLAMSATGQLLDIRSIASAGAKSVRVARYGSVPAPAGFAVDTTTVLRSDALPVIGARTAIGGSITGADIVDAVANADSLVVEAWLVERGDRFNVDARRLLALADAGVPGRITDLMIALSYPERFALDRSARLAAARTAPRGTTIYAGSPVIDPFGYGNGYSYGYGPLGYGSSPYGNGYRGYGYGYGYGYGGYVYQPPVVIVRGSGGTAAAHGRVVNGRGYQRDPSATSGAQPASPTRTPSSSGSGGSSSGTSSSGSGTSSSSGSDEHRQAKPRP